MRLSLSVGNPKTHQMTIRDVLTEPSNPRHPAFGYGLLFAILLLLANYIWWRLSLPSTYSHDPNVNGVVVLMLLFNILAYQFRWPASATVVFRILAWGWIFFGFFYLLHWRHILYPTS
jgi:hypothetical protein